MKSIKPAMIQLNHSKGERSHLFFKLLSLICHLLSNVCKNQNLISALNSAPVKEEVLLKQKSRVNWLRNDSNNRYFFNTCKGRWNCNKILSLEDADGNIVHSHTDISNIAVNYFESLMGSSKNVEPFPDDLQLPVLNDLQKASPVLDIYENDIFKVLRGM